MQRINRIAFQNNLLLYSLKKGTFGGIVQLWSATPPVLTLAGRNSSLTWQRTESSVGYIVRELMQMGNKLVLCAFVVCWPVCYLSLLGGHSHFLIPFSATSSVPSPRRKVRLGLWSSGLETRGENRVLLPPSSSSCAFSVYPVPFMDQLI